MCYRRCGPLWKWMDSVHCGTCGTPVKVTANYAPGLFYTYDVPDVPRTNNDLEQCFGSVRWHERRAIGRTTVPGFVVRGPVRVFAAAASHFQCFCVQALQLHHTQD